MRIEIVKTPLANIESMRVQFLHENNFQFVHNKCHLYGWADTYSFLLDGDLIGYGCVWGSSKREDRDCIFEFFLLKPYRQLGSVIYSQFAAMPGIERMEAQTNDLFQSTLLFQHGKNITAEAILFEDAFVTEFKVEGAIFRKATAADRIQMGDDDSDYVIDLDGKIGATGGLLLNYNLPYADLYMGVKEPFRRLGLGTLIVQELKRTAYLMGRVPAARCNINNQISKSTLMKAGFKVCGVMLNAMAR